MNIVLNLVIIAKYAVCVVVLGAIILAPAYLARINGKGKYDMLFVRAASWLFGWTGLGWILSLIWATRRKSF